MYQHSFAFKKNENTVKFQNKVTNLANGCPIFSRLKTAILHREAVPVTKDHKFQKMIKIHCVKIFL